MQGQGEMSPAELLRLSGGFTIQDKWKFRPRGMSTQYEINVWAIGEEEVETYSAWKHCIEYVLAELEEGRKQSDLAAIFLTLFACGIVLCQIRHGLLQSEEGSFFHFLRPADYVEEEVCHPYVQGVFNQAPKLDEGGLEAQVLVFVASSSTHELDVGLKFEKNAAADVEQENYVGISIQLQPPADSTFSTLVNTEGSISFQLSRRKEAASDDPGDVRTLEGIRLTI